MRERSDVPVIVAGDPRGITTALNGAFKGWGE